MPACTCCYNAFVNCLHSADATHHIRSKWFVVLKLVLWSIVIGIIAGSIIMEASCYKSHDVISSVKTNVVGPKFHKIKQSTGINPKYYEYIMRIWRHADYLIPSTQGDFFVPTNAVVTENQSLVKSASKNITCNDTAENTDCKNGTIIMNRKAGTFIGVTTGECINNTCEIYGWSPEEKEDLEPPYDTQPLISGLEDFVVIIKNFVHYVEQPEDSCTTNFMNDDINSDTSLPDCKYDDKSKRDCPAFTIGQIVSSANETYTDIATRGGVIRICVNWDCNIKHSEICLPTYTFTRIDDKNITHFDPGWYTRKYVYTNDTFRTVIKLYGIQFEVRVSGSGRKLEVWECAKSIGSLLSYFGFSAFIIALVALTLKDKENQNPSSPDSGSENQNGTTLDDILSNDVAVVALSANGTTPDKSIVSNGPFVADNANGTTPGQSND